MTVFCKKNWLLIMIIGIVKLLLGILKYMTLVLGWYNKTGKNRPGEHRRSMALDLFYSVSP
jgi:hypothetical protein